MLALLGVTALPASGEVTSDGPQVGQWTTWVLASGNEIQVPAPPAETAEKTKVESLNFSQFVEEQNGPSIGQTGVRHKGMLTGEWLLYNTLHINVVYTSNLGRSIPCFSLPSRRHGAGGDGHARGERGHHAPA
jgi:hypothetical protein